MKQSRTLPLHERLKLVLAHMEQSLGQPASPALRLYLRERGVQGSQAIHATSAKLAQWLGGRGTPPPYILDLVADWSGASYAWLRDGVGAMFADGRAEPEPPPVTPPSASPPPLAPAPALPAEPTKPEPVDPPEVSIPTREEVHQTSTRVIAEYLQRTTSAEAVSAILRHEESNPEYEGGRSTVLDAARRRLAALMPEA